MTAAILAGLAAALLLGSAPARALDRLTPSQAGPARRAARWPWLVAGAAGLLLVGAWWGVRPLGWVVTFAVAGGTVARLVATHRAAQRARRAAEDCARAAGLLASLLRAGQIPSEALATAAEDCPVLGTAAAAARLGTDVPAELARASARPGCAGLARIGAAWQVCQESGAPIAPALSVVADALRADRRLAAMVEAELAAARMSGRIMAALPFAAVGLGFAAGVNPVAFLLGQPLGGLLVLAGVVLTAVGVLWIDRLANPAKGAT
ncbi:MAG: type II secretion system F family protein [Arachnia sp.]